MMNKDIMNDFTFDKDLEQHYFRIFTVIEKMQDKFKGVSFDEFESLEDSDEDIVIQLINDLIDEFTVLSKKALGEIEWEKFQNHWVAPEFWEAVITKTKSESDNYIKMEAWRNKSNEYRNVLISKIFKYNYQKKEDREFICKELDVEEEDVLLFFEVLMESEKVIFLYSFSKRRYMNFIGNKYGIDNYDMEMLWNLYQENEDLIDKIVSRRVNNLLLHRYENLDRKIVSLQNQMDEIQDAVSYIIENVDGSSD